MCYYDKSTFKTHPQHRQETIHVLAQPSTRRQSLVGSTEAHDFVRQDRLDREIERIKRTFPQNEWCREITSLGNDINYFLDNYVQYWCEQPELEFFQDYITDFDSVIERIVDTCIDIERLLVLQQLQADLDSKCQDGAFRRGELVTLEASVDLSQWWAIDGHDHVMHVLSTSILPGLIWRPGYMPRCFDKINIIGDESSDKLEISVVVGDKIKVTA